MRCLAPQEKPTTRKTLVVATPTPGATSGHDHLLPSRYKEAGGQATRIFATMAFMKMPDLSKILHSDPEILGGTPVFVGTRVPVQSLFDHLEAGESIDDFIEGFPSVRREQVIALLERSRQELLRTG